MAVALFVFIYSFKLAIAKEEGFIVGGDVVDSIRTFPHVAFLTLDDAYSDDAYICGASVLNQLILISAAHCFDNIDRVSAYVGNVHRWKGNLYRVMSFKPHEKWNTDDPSDLKCDIAICRLKTPLRLGQKVKRVVLMERPPTAQTADLAGWGSTDERLYTETIYLKHIRQKLWTRQKCSQIVHNLPNGTICAGEKYAEGNFASKGDSGSGLLVYNTIIVGLVSYKNVKVSRSLVVFTDVAYFYEWIVRASERLICY